MRTTMDNNKENVETQQPKRDETSASTVKTPLVDALRSYFQRTNEIPETMYEWGVGIGIV